MRRLLPISIALVVMAALWWREVTERRSLEAQLPPLRGAPLELAAARNEQARLQAGFPSDEEVRALQAAAARHSREEPADVGPGVAPGLSTSGVGEWSPVASWGDRGNATPRATLETALWAAAGGDAPRFAQLLELPAAVRERADAILATLPATARDRYSTAEALIAAFTIKAIPMGPAAVVWARESDEDRATLAVFVRNPDVPRPAPTLDPGQAPPSADAPTMTREQAVAAAKAEVKRRAEARPPGYVPPPATPPHTIVAYLSLHRGPAGWRLQVPLSAIEKISRELTKPMPD